MTIVERTDCSVSLRTCVADAYFDGLSFVSGAFEKANAGSYFGFLKIGLLDFLAARWQGTGEALGKICKAVGVEMMKRIAI